MEYSSDLYLVILQYEDTNNNKIIDIDTLYDYLKNNDIIQDFYFILHDKEDKTLHYHIVLKLHKPRQKSKLINMFSSELFINRDIVSVTICNDFIKSLRYLTHKDNKEKYQYANDEVYSLHYGSYSDTIKLCFNPYQLNFDNLIDIISRSNSKYEVYSAIGLKNAKLYRHIIDDLLNEKYLFKKEVE